MADEKDLKLEALEKGFEKMQKRLEEMEAENTNLKKANATKEAVKKAILPKEPVKVGNKKYRFLAPKFRFKKKTYIAEAELENSELHKELIDFKATTIFVKA